MNINITILKTITYSILLASTNYAFAGGNVSSLLLGAATGGASLALGATVSAASATAAITAAGARSGRRTQVSVNVSGNGHAQGIQSTVTSRTNRPLAHIEATPQRTTYSPPRPTFRRSTNSQTVIQTALNSDSQRRENVGRIIRQHQGNSALQSSSASTLTRSTTRTTSNIPTWRHSSSSSTFNQRDPIKDAWLDTVLGTTASKSSSSAFSSSLSTLPSTRPSTATTFRARNSIPSSSSSSRSTSLNEVSRHSAFKPSVTPSSSTFKTTNEWIAEQLGRTAPKSSPTLKTTEEWIAERLRRTVPKSSPVSEAPSPKSIADSRKVADHVSHAFSVDDGRRSPPPVNTAIRRTTSQVQEKVTGITQDLTQRAMTSVIARPNTALSQSTNLASRLGDVHIPTPLDGLQTADQATGGAISRFSDGETYGTATRRLLRDSAGVSPAIAQNAGDIVHGGVELAFLCGTRGEGAAAKGAGKAFGRATRTVQTVSRPKRVLAASGRTAEIGSSIPKRTIPSAASKIEYHSQKVASGEWKPCRGEWRGYYEGKAPGDKRIYRFKPTNEKHEYEVYREFKGKGQHRGIFRTEGERAFKVLKEFAKHKETQTGTKKW